VLIHQVGGAALTAAQLVGPETAFAAVSPDPEHIDSGWFANFTDRTSGELLGSIPFNLGGSPAELLWTIVDGLADAVPTSSRFWGRPFPECDEHPHQCRVRMSLADDGEPIGVALRCPADDHLVQVVTA
jgi:hypothetical protein